MEDSPTPELQLPGSPRWLEVSAGIFLFPMALLCLMGSITLVIDPPAKSPLIAAASGVLFVLLSVWLLGKSFQLIANRPTSGGLMGPIALRLSAGLFFLLPFAGLFTGYYRAHFLIAILQTTMYFIVSASLFRLAKSRSFRP
jgi:hypothetical protein